MKLGNKRPYIYIYITAVLSLLLTACNGTDEQTNSSSIPVSTAQGTSATSTTSEETSLQSSFESTISTSTESTVSTSVESTSTDATPFTPPNNNQDGEMSGSILVLPGGRGIMLYGIGYEPGRNYAATVNKYKEELGRFRSICPKSILTRAYPTGNFRILMI